jgi:hypothetical protein
MNRRDFLRSSVLTLIASLLTVSGAPADARAGRPASPNSVAGVRRRSHRRARRRTRRRIRRHQTLYSLPYGCSTTRYRDGVRFYYCGGIWYRPAYQGTTVVYIVDDIERGASTDLEFYE